ncbi:MAG: hypothetical protein IPL92_08280 [Saprospiraceae bacterium]|nr:hypothetical protein [Candidatus Opimibacter iunctus]
MRLSLTRMLILLLGLSTVMDHPLMAQLPPDIRLYDASDGLSFRDVRFGARDPRGFLWIVNSGIDFYDGQSVTSYNRFDPSHQLPVSNIRSAAGLWDSLIIFSEVKDLFALNMMRGKVKPFPYPEGMDLDFNDLISIADRQHHPDILLFTRSSKGTKIHLVDRNWRYRFGYEVSNTESFFPKLMRLCQWTRRRVVVNRPGQHAYPANRFHRHPNYSFFFPCAQTRRQLQTIL